MTPEVRKRTKEMENECMVLKMTLALMHILLIYCAWQKHMVTMPVAHYNGLLGTAREDSFCGLVKRERDRYI